MDILPRTMKAADPERYARGVFRFRVVSKDDPEEVKAACKMLVRTERVKHIAEWKESEDIEILQVRRQ